VKGYLLIEAGGARYGLSVDDVREVIEVGSVHPAPSAHAAVLGVTQVAGRFIPLVHLRALVEREETCGEPGKTGVVVRCGAQRVVLAVDDADTVIREAPESVPEGLELPWAAGVARYEGDLVPIVDMEVMAERLLSVSAGE
jgi:chemotaxis signal transduction protein